MSVDGTALQVFGSMKAELMLGSREFQSEIIVVSPLTTQAILGVDFLKEYETHIDFSSGQLKLGGCNPLALNLRQGTMRGTGVGTVQLSEKVKIPPFSEQVVMAELSGPAVPNGVCVLESPS